MKWPDYYPENCPPPDAEPASGTFYRLVQNDPPRDEDFIPTFKENPKRFDNVPSIHNCGLSIQKDIQDSINLKYHLEVRRQVPRFRNCKIAKGKLNPTLGKIKYTPSLDCQSHHTWWTPIDAEPWLVFRIIEEDIYG